MQKITSFFLVLFAGLIFAAAAHAAPVTYRLDPWMHVEMYIKPGQSGNLIGLNGPLAPMPLSFVFTYDSAVALTPLDLPPDSSHAIYIDRFLAAGAFSGVQGQLGSFRFSSDELSSQTWSFTTPDMVPTDKVYTGVGAVGKTVGDGGSNFSNNYDGKNFKLTYVSLTFAGSATSDVLPTELLPLSGGSTQLQLDLVAEDGSVVTVSYFAAVTEVPVPGALWLFGSGLLAPIALRIRSRRK